MSRKSLGAGTGGERDTVNIGNSGGLQSIRADVQVQNDPSFTNLFINDNGSGIARTATIDLNGAFGYITGLAPANIFWDTADISGITINTGTAADTINIVRSTELLFLNSAGGRDTVTIGGPNGLQNITADIQVQNDPSFTNLFINDTGSGIARTATIDINGVFGYVVGLAPASIFWDTADIAGITITTGSAADTVNVVRSSELLFLNSAGDRDTVNIGGPNGLQTITADIQVQNDPSFTTLNINDTGSAITRTATIDINGVFGFVAGLAPVSILWDNFDIAAITITTGSGLDTVNIERCREGLKHLADRWAAAGPGKPFPVRLLNRTEVIDKERAEFLFSLA